MKPYMRDYRVGEIKFPTTELAMAVAASSAFPPFLSPLVLNLKESAYTLKSGFDLQRKPFTTRVVLTDGGVYDNLGIETAWKRYDTILVSDAGGSYGDEPKPKRNWLCQALRTLDLIDNQVRSLRRRQVVDSFKLKVRKGAYWGIRTNIAEYELNNSLPCPIDKTIKLANTPTRLKRLAPRHQEKLINWGYAVCDAALRSYFDENLPPSVRFPYLDVGVG
jgi:NTE family protein